MKNLVIYLKPFRRQCIVGPICKLVEAILEILLPTIMAFVINNGVVKHNTSLVFTLGCIMLIMVFIGFGFSMICQYQAALASQGFGTNLRNILMKHITTFSYEDLDVFGTSSLSNRLINDINQLQIAVAMLIRLVIRCPFIIIGAIVMSVMLDHTLSLLLIASVPFIALVLFVFIKVSSPLYRTYQKKLDRFAQLLDDNFSGVRVIRAFVSQRQEKKAFYKETEGLQKQMMHVSRCSALLNPLTALIVNSCITALMWFGIIQLPTHSIEPGTIIAFINYATQILIALIATSNLIVIFTRASACAQRVHEVLQHIPSMQEGTQKVALDSDVAIRFSHVDFSYTDQEMALHDIDLTIHKQETIGIIGGTGAGKSTLVHLLCRFYDIQAGKIYLYSKPISDISFSSIRSTISLVSQKNELFSDTIYNNLVMGQAFHDDAIKKALQDAQAWDFIKELKDGWDTMLERGGANLSGGQKQRLCIARALLRKSPILILDDSCSALDFKTDARLRKALRTYDATRIIVSQRVGTLMNCDRILVLNDGEAVGFATHTQLYDHCPIYLEICKTQHVGRDAS